MNNSETDKFITDRHPTMGDAAGRRVPVSSPDAVVIPQPHVTPLMQDAVIGRKTARALLLAFALIVVVPGVWAIAVQLRPNSILTKMIHHPGSQKPHALTRELVSYSPSSMLFKKTWGISYARVSGDALGNVIIGRDGYLFYKDDYDLCTLPEFLSSKMPVVVDSIVQYSHDLQQRGIHFIVMPVPAKTAIIPWKLWPSYPIAQGPAHNADYRRWVQTLRDQGVDVVDLTDDYWKMALAGEIPYMPQDTHWTPDAMHHAAELLAQRIRPYLGEYPKLNYTARDQSFSEQGDLVDIMGDKGDFKKYPSMQFHLTQVLLDGKPAEYREQAPVLLLGDSYTQVFADPNDPPGFCGLPQHLMLELGTRVQCFSGYGERFSKGREILLEHPETLRNKKVVVWEFSARVLPATMVPLPPP